MCIEQTGQLIAKALTLAGELRTAAEKASAHPINNKAHVLVSPKFRLDAY